MLLARENGVLKVFGNAYRIEFAKDRPFVFLDTPSRKSESSREGYNEGNCQGDSHSDSRVAELFVLSSIHPVNGRDDTVQTGPWRAEEGLNETVISMEVRSSAWKSKIIRFRCLPERFLYEVEVQGQGEISEAVYFGGYASAHLRWGSGFFWSGQHFMQGFNPEPNCAERYTFAPESHSAINMTGGPLPGRGDWFFTPPPFCFGFETRKGWLSLGIETRAGENRFCDYQYHGSAEAFHLTLDYEGHTHVDGRYLLPAVAFDFGSDPYALLAGHVQHLREAGHVPTPAAGARPEWWSEPIFCGWGAQCHVANVGGGRAPDYATQANYEDFLQTLSENGICPGTVVLDDKWQECYGDNPVDLQKWPDLPGFIRSRHAAGQRVLLWIKAWDPEGIPVEECITNAAGLPVAIDPTNPAFERRLRRSIRRMLSAEGYDADGFKIDFSARIPSGPGIQTYADTSASASGTAWGLELMRLYLSIIHDEAHRVKADAFIITHTPHPYLADVVDAIRLNDINTDHDVNRQMIHRARVAKIACPEALIDMDNWPMRDKAAWRKYLALKPGLGVPALYFASHIDSTGEAFTEEDYTLLRAAWAGYRAAQASENAAATPKMNEPGGSFQRPQPRTHPSLGKPLKALGTKGLDG